MATSIEIHDSLAPISDEWEDLAGSGEANPFLRPLWTEEWWRAFGSGRLHILAARRDGRLVGVLPLHRLRGRLQSITNPHTPLFGLLASDEDAAGRLAEALFQEGAPRMGLSFLLADDPAVASIRKSAEAAHYHVAADSIPATPYVSVDGDWKTYESGLRTKFRSEIRRRKRRLEEEGELSLEVLDGTRRLDALLDEGFRVEGSGWKGAYGTSIDSSPATRQFYTRLALRASERGWLRLAFLRLGGEAIAFDYCLELNKTHYLIKTGFDDAYGKFGPGVIMRSMMLSKAFSEDVSTYDFLGIGDAWKREWTDSQQELLFLNMFAPTAQGHLHRAAFHARRAAVNQGRRLARRVVPDDKARRILGRKYANMHSRIER